MAELDVIEKRPIAPTENGVNINDDHIAIDHVAEQKVVHKLDRHIVPMIMLLYLFSFLDRRVSLRLICNSSQG